MAPHRFSCVVVGLGNIGSHLATLVARLPRVGRMILVDYDRYDEGNLSAQSVRASDVGRRKAVVIGRQLRTARPDLDVIVYTRWLQDVPLAVLRADVILGCLDRRSSRMALNERAVALGVPLIDAGVSANGLLARVSVLPSAGVCLECSWDDEAYASVDALYACDGGRLSVSPTSAPAFLGATAASFQAARCAEILAGEWDKCPSETVLDIAHGRLLVSSLKARANCRLAPHAPWAIERLSISPASLTLAEAFEFLPQSAVEEGRSIELSRGPVVTSVRCVVCGCQRRVLRLFAALTARDRVCRACGGETVAGGMDLRERIDEGALARAELSRSLARIGAQCGDVLTVQAGDATRRFELAMPAEAAPAAGARA